MLDKIKEPEPQQKSGLESLAAPKSYQSFSKRKKVDPIL